MIETLIVIAAILFIVFLNSLVFITGLLATPIGSVYLGTVHWPGDYFYYLSQFAQGKESWFKGFDLFTSDFTSQTYVGWVNIFLGHIFNFVRLNQFIAYQISIIIFCITFLGISYLLIREIFPEFRRMRIIAFLLFLFSNPFPKIIFDAGKISISYYDFWFNQGILFNRVVGVPHQLIARSCISLILLLVLKWWKNGGVNSKGMKRGKYLMLLSFPVLGLVLASVEPVHWLITSLVLFIAPILICGSCRFPDSIGIASPAVKSKVANTIGLLDYWIIGLFFFLGGLPMALYLKKLFGNLPYLQLSLWENSQQLHVDPITFIMGNGPVMVIAIFGIWGFMKKASLSKITALVFIFTTIFLYFSPIPALVKIVNVRFLPAPTTIFLACIASYAIETFANRFPKKKLVVAWLIVIICISITLPALSEEIKTRTRIEHNNSFFYVSKTVIDAYKEAEKISNIKDTFLVIWPFNWSFPGWTGRRVFEGHTLLTINQPEKEKASSDFFDGKMSKYDMEKFITANKINYILTYTWTGSVKEMSNLTKIYDNNWLALYRVNNSDDR